MTTKAGTQTRRRAPLVAPTFEPDDAVTEVLRAVFPGVDVEAHRDAVSVTSVPAGTALCEEGDPAEVAWVVVRGRLRILRAHVPVADLGPTSVIGESGLTVGGVRAATIVARRDTIVAELSRQWLADVVGDDPTSIGHLLRSLDRTGVSVETTERTIALVPAGASDKAVDTLVARLRSAPDTVVVDEAMSRRGSGWLRDLEDSSNTVVLRCDPSWTAWTERAVNLADRVVTMVDATAPGLHPVEVALAEVPDMIVGSRTAVFVHPDGTPAPRRTRELLALRPDTRHLHLRETHARDHGRVSRHLRGQTVALVVSGGGARSLAAIGVYRELRRRGIPDRRRHRVQRRSRRHRPDRPGHRPGRDAAPGPRRLRTPPRPHHPRRLDPAWSAALGEARHAPRRRRHRGHLDPVRVHHHRPHRPQSRRAPARSVARARYGPACRCRACSLRSISTGTSTSTAASSTTCPCTPRCASLPGRRSSRSTSPRHAGPTSEHLPPDVSGVQLLLRRLLGRSTPTSRPSPPR